MNVNLVCKMVREIRFFANEQGRKPVEDFLDSLSSKQAQKATWVMSLIEDLKVVPKKFFKKMIGTEDIWEIRVQYYSNIFRILGFLMAPFSLSLRMLSRKNLRKSLCRKSE